MKIDVEKIAVAEEAVVRKYPPTGTFRSKVVFVGWSENYVEGVMLEVHYVLYDADDNEYEFRECFRMKPINQRTADFLRYLSDSGIEDTDDFHGCEEEVVIKKNAVGEKMYHQIVERSFIDKRLDDAD